MHADCMLTVALGMAFYLKEEGRSTVPNTRPLSKETNVIRRVSHSGILRDICFVPFHNSPEDL